MKKSTKAISIILVFFLIIAVVIIGRTMIGNHFKKKFSKVPPPGIIVTDVIEKEFSKKIETFGTAISKRSETFKIKKDDLIEDFKLKNFVKKGEILVKLKSGNIIAPFNGMLGYTSLTEDILVSNNIFIITLDDNSTIYSDIKIPETSTKFILEELYKRGIQSVLIEGGSRTLQYFIIDRAWDEARVIVGDRYFEDGIKAPVISKVPCDSISFGEDKIFIYNRT